MHTQTLRDTNVLTLTTTDRARGSRRKITLPHHLAIQKGDENSHKDLAIIAARIAQAMINMLFINEDITYDVLYSNVFWKIGACRLARVRNVTSSTGLEILVIGSIILLMTIEGKPEVPLQTIEFLILDSPSA